MEVLKRTESRGFGGGKKKKKEKKTPKTGVPSLEFHP